MKQNKKIIAENLVDKYELIISFSDEDQCYLATAPSLKGCLSHGDTPEEALINGRDAILSWLDMSLQKNLPFPDPDKSFSGNFNLRIPKSLHKNLAQSAKKEGVSLNQYVLHILSKAA